jgi:hypothetical protein
MELRVLKLFGLFGLEHEGLSAGLTWCVLAAVYGLK